MPAAGYAGYDRDELDRQYSPSSCVSDIGPYLDEYARRSAAARATFAVHTDLPYGPEPSSRFDYFPSTRRRAPLHVFVHGGYWQQLGKADAAFPALEFVPRGVAFAALGYGLAPEHSLDEIVRQVRTGLWYLATHLAELPGAPSRLHLSGHSAGAHLVTMALQPGWTPDGRHPVDLFDGGTLLSGVYDLEPLRHTYVNDPLGLDAVSASRNSPVRWLPPSLPPLVVARGVWETDEFARQHDEFAATARARGGCVIDVTVAQRNHFDLPFDLGVAGSVLDGTGAAAESARMVPGELPLESLPRT
ncbi:alpha/beta hydrolase [Amycolatopsis sp. NPDC088138]|uniref:alpha/beta hydrolase n=1 Tax=Amycolatopsis sp. NPDC088138 TaxID=3363938 RepID=UPI00381F19EE